MKTKLLIEALRKAEEFKVAVSNISHMFEESPTIKMVYEDEEAMLKDDIAELTAMVEAINNFQEILKEHDSVLDEAINNPLTKEDIDELRSEGRLK